MVNLQVAGPLGLGEVGAIKSINFVCTDEQKLLSIKEGNSVEEIGELYFLTERSSVFSNSLVISSDGTIVSHRRRIVALCQQDIRYPDQSIYKIAILPSMLSLYQKYQTVIVK